MSRLQYNISSWDEATECLSNNSRKLRITISEYIGQDDISGKVISVIHENYGTLFACPVNASGKLISNDEEAIMLDESILNVLGQFGFDIQFQHEVNLDGVTLSYLKTLSQLDYDKLSVVTVERISPSGCSFKSSTIVCFKIDKTPDWLEYGVLIPESKLLKYVISGDAYIVDADKQFNWSWLNHVVNIEDVLEANS